MKNKLVCLITAVFMIGAPLIVITTVSCSTTQKQASYKTIKSVAEGVDSAMNAYAEAVVKGLVSDPIQLQVFDIHEKYRSALFAAIIAARFDYNTAPSTELASLAAQIAALVAQIVTQHN